MIENEPNNNGVLKHVNRAFSAQLKAHHFANGRYKRCNFMHCLKSGQNESIVFFRELPGCFSSASTTEGRSQGCTRGDRALFPLVERE